VFAILLFGEFVLVATELSVVAVDIVIDAVDVVIDAVDVVSMVDDGGIVVGVVSAVVVVAVVEDVVKEIVIGSGIDVGDKGSVVGVAVIVLSEVTTDMFVCVDMFVLSELNWAVAENGYKML
jgi:hypothetical protein